MENVLEKRGIKIKKTEYEKLLTFYVKQLEIVNIDHKNFNRF